MNECFQSYHQALFLVSVHRPRETTATPRRRQFHKIHQRSTTQFGHNHIEERCVTLSVFPDTGWTPSHTRKYNNLDNHITSCMLRAELICNKIGRCNGYLWSPDLHLAGSRLSFWHLLQESYSKLRKISETTLNRQKKMEKSRHTL
jgi:hypothetical protein